MLKKMLVRFLLLGIVIAVVAAEGDNHPPGHNEDIHDKEHEEATKEGDEEVAHEDEKKGEHNEDEHDKKDDEHDEDEHDDDKKDDEDHDDDHDDEKDDKDDDKDDDLDEDKDDEHDSMDSNEGGEHDTSDQDAFLGEHAKDFKGLSTEEQKQKLEHLVKSEIDLNKDGFLEEAEIRTRLLNVSKKHRRDEVNSTAAFHDENKDGKVSWDEFKKAHYTHQEGKQDDNSTKEQMVEDEAKFKHADLNGDGMLSLEEYVAFYHPGDDERMSTFVIADTLNKYDADKDGQISKDEYLSSFKDINNDAKAELEKDFVNTFDTNKDGKLDQTEMKEWLFPEDGMAKEEPAHMIKEADDNKDGKLSMEEILKHHTVFIDSADDVADHDEL